MLKQYFRQLYQKAKWSKLADVYRYIKYPHYRRSLRTEMLFFSNLIKPDAMVFDIGANVGRKTFLFLRLKAKNIIAVEPSPDCLNALACRFSKNKRVEIIARAVSDRETTEALFMSTRHTECNTLSSKWMQTLEDQHKTRFEGTVVFDETMKISTTTLDHLILRFGTPDVIKLDIEGFELQALRGLSRKVKLDRKSVV